MDDARHIPRREFVRFFTGQRIERLEAANALDHLPLCSRCRFVALEVNRELRRTRRFKAAHGGLGAIAEAIEQEQRRMIDHLEGRAGWIRVTSTGRIPARGDLAPAAVEAGLEDLEARSFLSPTQGEEMALLLLRVIDSIPQEGYPSDLAQEHRARTYCSMGNFRRLLTDWTGCESSLGLSRQLLNGLDRPALQARILSIEASLSFDTGNLDEALARMGRASEIHRREGDSRGLARLSVQRGATLATAHLSEEALQESDQAIRLLRAEDAQLELLALFVRTQALLQLGRVPEAIMSLNDSSAHAIRVGGTMSRLQRQWLEGLVLDALGKIREAEILLKDVISTFLDSEMFRNAVIVWFDLFESAFKRSSYDKAARVCEECIYAMRDSGVHDQMVEVWRDMLKLVRERKLRDYHLQSLRLYVSLHGSLPAGSSPLTVSKRSAKTC